MSGYQPEKKCVNCLAFNICKKKHKNQVCKKYKECRPAPPPKSGSLAITPQGVTYTPPQKQRTILSVRDFVILYNMANDKIMKMESQAQWVPGYLFDKEPTESEKESYIEKKMEQLRQNSHYQDILRIRDKLGELNIEIETPIVEVEE